MAYVALLCSIGFAVVNNILLRLQAYKKLRYDGFLFNVFVSIVWAALLIGYNGGFGGYSAKTWLYGGLYGGTLAGFLFFKQQTLVSGPIMLSSLIGGSSFVYTTLFNALYWKDDIGVFEILGILLMVTAVIVVTYRPKSKAEKCEGEKLSLRWKLCAACFFLFAGLTGIIFRFHQNVDKAHTNEMMIFASAVVVALLSAASGIQKLATRGKEEKPKKVAFTKSKLWAAVGLTVACGIVSCVYNRLNIYLSGALASTLFFPVFNGSVVLLAAVAGWCLFREKTTKRQFIGCATGLLSILCLSHFFGLA